jgi:hypothetical protein
VIQSIRNASDRRFECLRDSLESRQGLPFLDHLSEARVEAVCRRQGHHWRARIYTPWITLGIFLSQVLSKDQSCDDAVDRFQKYRYNHNLPSVSSETTSYCEARSRLPEAVLWDLVGQVGKSIHHHANTSWLFQGRPVKIADGSTVSMPDTPENQAAYPQPESQKPGVGFPIARLLVIFSLAVGTVLEAAVGPYQGKRTSELALLRLVIDRFQPGDVVLADRFFCSYWAIAALQARGVDVVTRLHQRRSADFRRGRRLGSRDHLVLWTKPKQMPDWMTRAEYDAMPDQLTIREFHVQVADKTKRVRSLVVVTTLLDAQTYRAEAVGDLYRQRWHAELDLRSLKSHMQMDVLRTLCPAMVRKEIAAHLLAYNLIRGLMAEAARVKRIKPRRLSFTGAMHTVRSFEQEHLYDPSRITSDQPRLLELIGRKLLADRLNRYEPRAVKRRPKPYPLLTMPRQNAKRMIKRGIMLYEKT